MKTFLPLLGLSVALTAATFAAPARAQDNNADLAAASNTNPNDSSVSFQNFYDQLSSQGTWIQTDKYGYVFQPTENDSNWRPYTYGHWVNSDAGMTWVSDDSFGWATDHYGRWVNLDGTGWVWVPGYTWAPAWVSWRSNDEDVGWAPLPPDSDLGIDYYGDGFDLGFGFHIGDDCDTAYGIGPACYNFCPIAYIGDRDAWRHFRDRRDNFAFIGRTRNVTNINFRRDGFRNGFDRVRAEGPSIAALDARANHRLDNVRLNRVSSVNGIGERGNTLGVYAPRIDRNSFRSARPDRVSGTIANARVNHGTDINQALAVNSRVREPAATPAQIQAASLAHNRGAFNQARVATTSTHASRGFDGSLTSLRTEPARVTSFSGTSEARTHAVNSFATTPAATQNHFTGVTPEQRRVVEQSRAINAQAPVYSRRAESTFTGTPATRTFAPTRSASAFDRQPAVSEFRQSTVPVQHTSAPVFRSSAPTYHPQVAERSFAAPSYHPQAVQRSFAPSFQSHAAERSFSQPHFSGGGNGGGFHAAAPAAHASGGGGAAHAAAAAGNRGDGHR